MQITSEQKHEIRLKLHDVTESFIIFLRISNFIFKTRQSNNRPEAIRPHRAELDEEKVTVSWHTPRHCAVSQKKWKVRDLNPFVAVQFPIFYYYYVDGTDIFCRGEKRTKEKVAIECKKIISVLLLFTFNTRAAYKHAVLFISSLKVPAHSTHCAKEISDSTFHLRTRSPYCTCVLFAHSQHQRTSNSIWSSEHFKLDQNI